MPSVRRHTPGPEQLDPDGSHSRASRDAEDLTERHGAALFALASLILVDHDDAVAVTAQAILQACNPPHLAPAVGRWELARYIYVLSRRLRDDAPALHSSSTHGRHSLIRGDTEQAALASLSSRQRSAIALGLFGEHDYREIADLMELTPEECAELLRSGLYTYGKACTSAN